MYLLAARSTESCFIVDQMSSLVDRDAIVESQDCHQITTVRRPHAATDFVVVAAVVNYWLQQNCSIIERLPRCYPRLATVKAIAARTVIAIIGVKSWC